VIFMHLFLIKNFKMEKLNVLMTLERQCLNSCCITSFL
jgi:hypothetical protein